MDDTAEGEVQATVQAGVEPETVLNPDQTSTTNVETTAEPVATDAHTEPPVSSLPEAHNSLFDRYTSEPSNGDTFLSPPASEGPLPPAIPLQPEMSDMDSVNNNTNTMDNGISADEIALYDRQIRLWGVQAQEKIRHANILLVTLKGLGNEIAKNLVLAGVASITLIDNTLVTEEDLGAQFFITEADIGKPRAAAASAAIQRLNPRVAVHEASIDIFAATPDFFTAFSLVIATDLPMAGLTLLNTACRFSGTPYYAAGSHGLYGFIFADLLEHTYAITRDKSNKTTTPGTAETATRTIVDVVHSKKDGKDVELVTKKEVYTPLLLANSAPLPSEYYSSPRRLRTVTPLLPCLRALWDFEKSSDGLPPSHNATDLQHFTRLATENTRELQLPVDVLKSDFLRSFLQNLYAELSPSCAYLGGLLAQDVINVLGGREQPLQNMVLWDGEDSKAAVYALVPMVQSLDGSL